MIIIIKFIIIIKKNYDLSMFLILNIISFHFNTFIEGNKENFVIKRGKK